MTEYGNAYFKFDDAGIVKGSLINTVTLNIAVDRNNPKGDTVFADIYGDKDATPITPTTGGDFAGKTATTATYLYYDTKKTSYQVLYSGGPNGAIPGASLVYNQSNPYAIPESNVTYIGSVPGGVTDYYFFAFFENVEIEQGAQIHEAYLQLSVTYDPGYTTTCSAIVYGNDVDDASPPQTIEDITSAALTTATGGIATNETSGTIETGDIKGVIQEIIDRPGWSSRNNIMILFFPTGSTSDDYRRVDIPSSLRFFAKSYETVTDLKNIVQEIVDLNAWEYGNNLGLMFLGQNNETFQYIEQGDTDTNIEINATGYATYIKFDSIGIEKGMQIKSAYIDLSEISDFFQAEATCRIYAEKTATASEFADGNALWAATKTTTYVDYTESATSGAATTPDIKSVLQEIINQANWSYGNNINLIFWGINNNAYKADISGVSASLRLTI